MEIQKIYSEQETGEKLYSVLLSQEEMRLYTRWDMTDQYKGMKDSDLLAEKKKSNLGTYVNSGKVGAIGAGVGAIGGALLGKRLGLGTKNGALAGAYSGGALGLAGGLAATHNKRADNRFANKRLAEIKYQAKRRDAKDWRSQTNFREGYTA